VQTLILFNKEAYLEYDIVKQPAKESCRPKGEKKYRPGISLDREELIMLRKESRKAQALARIAMMGDGSVQFDLLRPSKVSANYRRVLDPERWRSCAPNQNVQKINRVRSRVNEYRRLKNSLG
jgi:hypothetical protein